MKKFLSLLVGFLILQGACFASDPWSVANSEYELFATESDKIEIRLPSGEQTTLQPSFTVLYSEKSPGYDRNNSNYILAPRWALRWNNFAQPLAELNQWLNDDMDLDVIVTEDEKRQREWMYGGNRGTPAARYELPDGGWKLSGRYAQGTTNPFVAGDRTDLIPEAIAYDGRRVIWSFPSDDIFDFQAELVLPEEKGPPEIRYSLKAKKAGWFSAVFTGAPGVNESEAIQVPQQAAGGRRRQFQHVIPEINEKLPRAQVSDGEINSAVVVHSDMVPMDEKMVTYASSRFGVMIGKENGILTPMIFAPIMGADSSKLEVNQKFDFRQQLVFRSGSWQDTYRHIAGTLYNFRDMRDNSGTGSLNGTIRNVMDFLRNQNGHNYAMWHAEQKYYNYWSDKAGVFKPFSPIFGLGAAIVLDDEAFYRERVLPVVEFSLSRESNVFSPYDVTDTKAVLSQNRRLGKPFLSLPQLVSLYDLYQRRTYAFRYYAEHLKVAKRLTDLLAIYRLHGARENFDAAVTIADNQIRSNAGDAIDFLEVYEATGEQRFLEAAQSRIYETASTFFNLFPEVPDEMMTFDRGGKVPVHAHSSGRHRAWGFPEAEGLDASEKKVPAWRGSEIGLESFAHHRAELWLNNQPTFMRVAAFSDDDFLRTLARWGMVGRYANYAGDNRSERSLVTELPDAPEHPIWRLTYSSFNPGHAWEFVGAMIDFLVTDCFDRSQHQIAFPPSTMAGSAFRVRAYGAFSGRFYDEKNVHLWMPQDLLASDNPQVDWLAAWGNGKLYLAFWNQSFQSEDVKVTLNSDRVTLPEEAAPMREWLNNEEQPASTLGGSELEFTLPPKGIYACAIEGAVLRKILQEKMFADGGPHLGPGSIGSVDTDFGKVHGMLLSMGTGLTSAFVYTEALPESVNRVKFRYRQGVEEWTTVEDAIFPFELSVWIDEAAGNFECVVEARTMQLKTVTAPPIILSVAGTPEL